MKYGSTLETTKVGHVQRDKKEPCFLNEIHICDTTYKRINQ